MPLPITGGVKLLGVDITKQLGGLVKGVPVVGNLFAKNKNAGRMAANQRAYQLAITKPTAIFEDQKVTGLQFLLMKSPKAVGGQGGWATQVAQDDAYAKYQMAKQQMATLPPAKTATSPGQSLTEKLEQGIQEAIPAPAKEAAEEIAKVVGTKSSTVTWIALGLGAVLVVKSLRSR